MQGAPESRSLSGYNQPELRLCIRETAYLLQVKGKTDKQITCLKRGLHLLLTRLRDKFE